MVLEEGDQVEEAVVLQADAERVRLEHSFALLHDLHRVARVEKGEHLDESEPLENPRIPLVPLIMIHNCRLEALIDSLLEIL